MIKSLAQKLLPYDEDLRKMALFKDAIHCQILNRFDYAFSGRPSNSNYFVSAMNIGTLLDPKFKGNYFTPVESIRVSLF